MTNLLVYKGFAGAALVAECHGDADRPAVLIVHDHGQTRSDWSAVAAALDLAGRTVINLDLRGHGGSEWPADGRYDFAAFIDDLRAVLAQMNSRPVVIGAGLGGRAAICALGEDGGHLASALVFAAGFSRPVAADQLALAALAGSGDGQFDPRLAVKPAGADSDARVAAAAARVMVPVLVAEASDPADAPGARLAAAMADAEYAAIGASSSGRADELGGILLDFLERRVPLVPPTYREGSDARTFRDALGCFATGITVITAMTADGTPVGLTANSFTSVSLDPPLLLVCIANSVSSAAVMRSADRFAVNVLQIGQQPTSNRFAGKGEDRFAATPWSVGEFGTPVLTGSLSSFECARHEVHDGGDHFILVGRVLKAMFEPQRDPLLYFRGKYRRLHFA